MKLTHEQLAELLKNPTLARINPGIEDHARPNRSRTRSELQEPKANPGRSQNPEAAQLHRSEAQEADERAGRCYHVRVVFLVSDRRKRDAFGMLETVADALIRAVRRFNSGSAVRQLER